jgi:transcriptional regulator with XRE-family HTH domain
LTRDDLGGFVDDLRNIRRRRGLTQADLAAGTGVSEFTISEIESGKRPNARPSTLRKLAEGLGVTVADLYGEPFDPKGFAPHSLAGWLEERCGHAYLALPKDEFEDMFDRIPEGAPERRELALEVNREYNVFCNFPRNVAAAERLSMRKMIRSAIPDVAVKHGVALMEGDLDREYQEEAARIFEVQSATESETA